MNTQPIFTLIGVVLGAALGFFANNYKERREVLKTKELMYIEINDIVTQLTESIPEMVKSYNLPEALALSSKDYTLPRNVRLYILEKKLDILYPQINYHQRSSLKAIISLVEFCNEHHKNIIKNFTTPSKNRNEFFKLITASMSLFYVCLKIQSEKENYRGVSASSDEAIERVTKILKIDFNKLKTIISEI